MKVRLHDKNDSVIIDDFPTVCNKCISNNNSESINIECPLDSNRKRIGKIKSETGIIFGCCDTSDHLKSSKTFKKELKSYLHISENLTSTKNELNLQAKRLIHNLTKTNGHNIQELYALVPQETLTQNLSGQLKTIKDEIIKDPDEAAKTFLRIVKNNAAMKTEFSVFNKLLGGKPILHNKRHPVLKATLNLFHIFFQKFNERNVYVDFEENKDYLIFDYDSFHVALYHLIDNAAKYTLPNTKLYVRFEKGEKDYSILFDMISLRIGENEKNKIYEEGYSGELAHLLHKSGDGIGLDRVSKILEVMNAELIILPRANSGASTKQMGIWYDNNVFEVRFKNYAQQRPHKK